MLLAVFLIGFVPEYVRANRLSGRVEELSRDRSTCELRDLAGRLFLETSMKNYGTALQYASRFFDRARVMAGAAESPQLRQALQEALSRRDAITAGLARGDASVYGPVQDLYRLTLERIP